MSRSNRALGDRSRVAWLCLLLLLPLTVSLTVASAAADPVPAIAPAQEEPAPSPREEPTEPTGELEDVEAELSAAAEEAAEEIAPEVAPTTDEEQDEREARRRERRSRVDKDTQVHFFSDLEIEENEVAREAVVIMGALEVKGKVLGDTVSIMGPTYIEGEVTGTVTAVMEAVYLGPDARVTGDVISVGSSVEMDPGAQVLGEISEVDFGPALHFSDVPWDWHDGWGFWSGSPLGLAWGAFWVLFRWVVLILIATLVFLVARVTVERTATAAASEPWKAGLLGLATWLLFFPLMIVVTIVLTLSIIGIPLLIVVWPLGLFALLIACLLGYTSVAYALGGWLSRRFGWTMSPYAALLVGIVAIQLLSLLARFFGSLGSFFWFFGVMFGLAGWLIRFTAWTVGLGAAIMAFAENRRARSVGMTPPPPPEATGDPVPDPTAGASPPTVAPPPAPPAPAPPPSVAEPRIDEADAASPDDDRTGGDPKPEA